MRKLIILTVVLATAYGAYWFIGRGQIEARLTEALAEMDAGPSTVTYESLRTRGFPSRFDTTIAGLAFEDPATRVRWEADPFQLFALAYRPNEVIAVFPPEQVIVVDGEPFFLFTNDMRASGKVRANAALSFVNTTITMENPRLRTEEGAELAMASLLAAMRLAPEAEQRYDVFFEARSMVLPEAIRGMIDPGGSLPELIQSVRLDSAVDLTVPLALNGDPEDVPDIEALAIREFAFRWGEISLTAIGEARVDPGGLLNGSVTFTAVNWEQALDLAVQSGAIPAERRQFFVGIAGSLDETPHIDDTLTTTLTITNGEMALGPVPLGAAPLLR